MSFVPPFTRFKRLFRRVGDGPKLPLALGIATVLSICLTILSVAWYSWDGSSKLDLSRPGYEQVRAEVRTTSTQETYDTTSPVTKSSIDGFLREYDARAKELSGYDDFNAGALDDNNIQLAPASGTGTQ